MAKIPYSKLKLKVDESTSICTIGEFEITVRNYLPIQEKLALISRIIELSHDADNNFSNPLRVQVYRTIEIIRYYTDITFTDKQLEDVPKLYDQIISAGLWGQLSEVIPQTELMEVYNGIDVSIESIYKYRNSVLGILDTISTDYENLNFDMDALQEKMADPQNLNLVKEILDKVN